jgi:DNA-binding CsgD family transcriptional regulator
MARSKAAPHNDKQAIPAAERRYQALELRRSGATLRQIAKTLGVHHTTAKKYLDDAMAELKASQNHAAEELRAVELDRLERLHLALWMKAIGSKKTETNLQAAEPNLQAVDRILRIAERRAKLLGIDAPAKIDMAVSGNLRVSYSDLVALIEDEDAGTSA